MAGLAPAIHVFNVARVIEDVDARHKAGHDGNLGTHHMRKDFTIGLVVPFATDEVPEEGLQMYPGVRFVPRGVGVRALTPEGYDSAWEGILPAAEYLAQQGVDAIMVIGTSLTFYRGADFHDQLLEKLRAATGLPVSTMSQAVVDGLRRFD